MSFSADSRSRSARRERAIAPGLVAAFFLALPPVGAVEEEEEEVADAAAAGCSSACPADGLLLTTHSMHFLVFAGFFAWVPENADAWRVRWQALQDFPPASVEPLGAAEEEADEDAEGASAGPEAGEEEEAGAGADMMRMLCVGGRRLAEVLYLEKHTCINQHQHR
jgi:hypothetical protein